MSGIASLFVEIGAKTEGLTSGLKTAESGLSGLAGKAGGLISAAATGFGFAIAGPIIGSVGGLFQQVTQGVMGTNSALEQSGTAWGVLLGGADQAQAKIAELFAFGASTPFEFGEVDKASRVLETFGGAALNTKDNLTMIGDVASGVGQPFGDVAMWTARMYDSFKNGTPFGEAAARLQEMGAMSGETRLKLEQLQAAGASQEELWAVLSGSFGKFGGMMQQQSGTFSGMLSTMQDSLNMLFATAGKPIFAAITAGLGKFNALLSSPAVQQGAARLASGIASALGRAGAFFMNFAGIVQSALSGNFQATFLRVMDLIGKVFGVESMAPVASFVGRVMGFLWKLKDGAVSAFQQIAAGFQSGGLGGALAAVGTLISGAFEHITSGNLQGKVAGFVSAVVGKLYELAAQAGGALLGLGAKFIGWITPLIPQALTAIGQFFTGLVGGITGVGVPQVEGALSTTMPNAFTKWVAPAIPILLTALGGLFTTLGTFIAGAVPGIVATLAQWGQAFGNWVETTALPWLMPKLQALGTAIGDWITGTALPAIGAKLAELGTAFGDWISTTAVPWLQAKLPEWGSALGDWITGTALPAVGTKLAELGTAFGDWIGGTAVPWLQAKLPEWGAALTGWLGSQVPVVQAKLTELGTRFGDWVRETAVPYLEENLPQWIAALGGWITGTAVPKAGEFLFNVALAFGDWVTQKAVPYLMENLPQWLSALSNHMTGTVFPAIKDILITLGAMFGDWLKEKAVPYLQANLPLWLDALQTFLTGTVLPAIQAKALEIGAALVNKFMEEALKLPGRAQTMLIDLKGKVSEQFDAMVSDVRLAMSNFKDAVVNSITGMIGSAASAAAQVGSAIVNGIAGAISAGAGAIADAARNAAQSALDAAKSLLGINSPSRAFAEVGAGVIEGFAKGINANAYMGVAAVTSAMQGALDAGQSLMQSATLPGMEGAAGGSDLVRQGRDSRGATIVNITNHIAGSVMADRDLTETIADRINQLSYVRRI